MASQPRRSARARQDKLAWRGSGAKLAATALAVGLLVSACSSPEPSPQPTSSNAQPARAVVIGATPTVEGAILARLYAKGLEERGIKTTVKEGLSGQRAGVEALKAGSIDVFPTYTGTLVTALNGRSQENTDDSVNTALKQALPTTISILDMADARDQVVLAITQVTAERHQVRSLENIARFCPEMAVAAPANFNSSPQGQAALKSVYQCVPKSITNFGADFGPEASPLLSKDPSDVNYAIPQPLKALLQDDAQIAVLRSSDPALSDNELVVLEDPKQITLAERVVPAIFNENVDQRVRDAINQITSQLKQEDLIALNRGASERGAEALDDVVMAWLKSKNLSK